MLMVWLSVRITPLTNQNTSSAAGGDVLADRPTQATRVPMDADPTAPFNPQHARMAHAHQP